MVVQLKNNKENIGIADCFKPHLLSAYVLKKREIEDYDLNEKYEKEIELYTKNFIKINNCNKWSNDYAEYPEYWEGVNLIRKKYNLNKIFQKECKRC